MPLLDLADFVNQPSVELLRGVKKNGWIEIASYCKVSINISMRKSEIN